MHDLAIATPQVQFCKVDVDQAQDVAQTYAIRAMPTFMFFKASNKIDMFEGADFSHLESLVNKHGSGPVGPTPIGSDDELKKMSAKQLLTLMAEHSISTLGLPEKNDLIAELIKHRK